MCGEGMLGGMPGAREGMVSQRGTLQTEKKIVENRNFAKLLA